MNKNPALSPINIENNNASPYQSRALTLFKQTGLPVLTQEQWRQTKNMAVFNLDLPQAEQFYLDCMAETFMQPLESCRLVCVNGYFCPHLSDEMPDGVSFISLSDAVSSQDSSLEWIGGIHAPYPQGYKHLNAVMCRDGVILKIEKNTHIQRPIQVIFKNVTADSAVYSRCLVVLEQGANATVMVRHDNLYNTHENHVTECYLAQDSDLTMIKTIMDTVTYHHIGTVSAALDKNANMNLAYYITGGDYCRYETNIYLNGHHANANIGSAVLTSDKNTCEHISTVIHTIPECTSSQMFQSLCDADGKITVQSKTIVMRDAQKTDAKQMLRGFLMHENAHIFAKPELEIYADDVKCSHGSTIGQLDKDALYYMRARGMDYATAKSLLTHSLVEQALAVIKNDDITDILLNHFADKIKNSRVFE